MNSTRKKLKKLTKLLGVPDTAETGFIVGGKSGRRIVDSRTGQETRYLIGG